MGITYRSKFLTNNLNSTEQRMLYWLLPQVLVEINGNSKINSAKILAA